MVVQWTKYNNGLEAIIIILSSSISHPFFCLVREFSPHIECELFNKKRFTRFLHTKMSKPICEKAPATIQASRDSIHFERSGQDLTKSRGWASRDVNLWARKGCFFKDSYSMGSLAWSRNAKQIASIGYSVHMDQNSPRVRLKYYGEHKRFPFQAAYRTAGSSK
jgi:hypothetical protein